MTGTMSLANNTKIYGFYFYVGDLFKYYLYAEICTSPN